LKQIRKKFTQKEEVGFPDDFSLSHLVFLGNFTRFSTHRIQLEAWNVDAKHESVVDVSRILVESDFHVAGKAFDGFDSDVAARPRLDEITNQSQHSRLFVGRQLTLSGSHSARFSRISNLTSNKDESVSISFTVRIQTECDDENCGGTNRKCTQTQTARRRRHHNNNKKTFGCVSHVEDVGLFLGCKKDIRLGSFA
jgi:hypothetical protein